MTSTTHIRGRGVSARGGGRSDWRCPARTSDVRLWGQMIVSCFPELQLPGFTGVDDPFMKDPERPHSHPFLYDVPHPTAPTCMQLSPSSGICCGRCRGSLVSRTCLCPRLCQFPSVGRTGPWAGFSPGPHPTPSSPRAPRWGWGRLRTSLDSGIKVSSAVSFVPTPAPCSPWVLRRGGRARTLPRGWN